MIDQNIYSMLDVDGSSQLILDSILDHFKGNSAIAKADRYIVTGKDRTWIRKSTIGWKLLVRWKE